jgi:tetratricopeptide (TPR) repeat protein
LEETVKRCKDTKHHLTLRMQASLGAIYCDAGRFADAIPVLEEVHRKGRTRPGLAWIGNALLTAYVGAGKQKEAVALATEKVRAAREQFPPGSLDLATALDSLGLTLLDMGAYAEAEPLFKDVLAIRIARWGGSRNHFPRDHLAHVCRALKKPDESIPLLEKSLQLRKARLPPDHGEILARQVTLGAAYCDAGRFEEGLALIEEVRRNGSDDPHPAWVRSVLLTAYVQAGKTAEATALAAERVQEARQRFAAGCPELAAVLADYGKILLDAKAYAEAEPLLLEASQGLKQAEHEKERLRNVLEWLMELYDAWGQPDEAAKWRTELEAVRTAEGGTSKDR